MGIEYLGEKVFLEEVEASGQVWVVKNTYQKIYAEELDQSGFSLPVWSNSERAAEYLLNARPIGPKYEPHAVPLEVFTKAWLSDRMKAIAELQINPDGRTSRILVMTNEEFQDSQGAD